LDTVSIGEICTINPHPNKEIDLDSECSFIPMDCIDDSFGVITKNYIKKVSEVQKGYTNFQDGDVL
jgi:type I restriction enzyme, S subunit